MPYQIKQPPGWVAVLFGGLEDAARFLGHKKAFATANTYAHSPQTHKAAIADSVSKRMQRMAA